MKSAVLKSSGARIMFLLVALITGATGVYAQGVGGAGMTGGGALPATKLPPNLSNVDIEQKLNSQLPLNAQFRDENGQTVTLGQYFKPGRPVLLSLVYYDCPMLCTEVLNGMTSMLKVLKFEPGKDFEVVTVSFDRRETPQLAAEKKKVYLQRYGRPGAEDGWHFLTGDQPSIDALTNAVGFHYQWDNNLQQFAHATGIFVATPDGRLSHYFYGVEYSPKDTRLALVQASQGTIGNPVDRVLLYCYHYDPRTGKYGAVVTRIMRIAGVFTIVIIGGGVLLLSKLDPNRKKKKLQKKTLVGTSSGKQ